MAIRLTRTELADKYPDEEWRTKFLELLSLVELLAQSIIDRKFKISDELNAAVQLTDAGKSVRDEMARHEAVPTKEANLLTLLATAHVDLLVDVDRMEFDKLRTAISKEIKAGAIRYPFILGRGLYDRASELFADERHRLSHEDTLRLLDDSPQGVFQSGHNVTGPLGVLVSSRVRSINPSSSIPLQHCSDHSCQIVHRIQLRTSVNAPINVHRRALNKVLDGISNEPSDWNGFISDIMENRTNSYAEEVPDPVVCVLGDCLDDMELRELLARAISLTDGRMVEVLQSCGLGYGGPQTLQNLDRATVLQLLFTESDDFLVALVDELVISGAIAIPAGEIRRPKINAHGRWGSWGFQGELGSRGYRSVGRMPGLPLLRLGALCREIYDVDSAQDMDSLAWVLRDVPGEAPRVRLEEYLRTAAPERVVQELVMSRRENAVAVGQKLGIHVEPDDDGFADTVLWKLGFPEKVPTELRDSYWLEHEALERICRTANVSLGSDSKALRPLASNYFVELERFLFDSLVFSTWTLTNDHYTSHEPYVFNEVDAEEFAIKKLNEITSSDEEFTSSSTLGPIVQRFNGLSKFLHELRGESDSHRRDSTAFPPYAAKSTLQRFPFVHSVPYLDLSPEAQVRIANVLATVGSKLNDSGILKARNGLFHPKKEPPSSSDLLDALARARQALADLETIGLTRNLYRFASSQTDAEGRVSTTFATESGNRIVLGSPNPFQWLGMPSLRASQYIAQGAIFAPPSAVLRFKRGFVSSYTEYWSDFPRRAASPNILKAGEAEAAPESLGETDISSARGRGAKSGVSRT